MVFSYHFTGFSSRDVVDTDIERTKTCSSILSEKGLFNTICRLLVQSVNIKNDALLSYLSAWTALEVFVNKSFKLKKQQLIENMTERVLDEPFQEEIEKDKFSLMSEFKMLCLYGLGNWYANLLRIDRRKCLLFTNEKSLYTFLIPKVSKANLKNIEEEFLINLSYNLQTEGFELEVINRVMQEYQEIGFAKPVSKSVLGSMNDFAYQYEGYIQMEGGLDRVKILGINQKINESPMSYLQYGSPLGVLRSLFVNKL